MASVAICSGFSSCSPNNRIDRVQRAGLATESASHGMRALGALEPGPEHRSSLLVLGLGFYLCQEGFTAVTQEVVRQ